MKRFLAILFALLLCLLTSCGVADTSEPDSSTESDTVPATETETETDPDVSGDTQFSIYAINGRYYIYRSLYENVGNTIVFNTKTRKMSIINKNGETTICSYDKNYYLSRIDYPSGSVVTFESVLNGEQRLTLQNIHYQAISETRDYSLAYTFDENGYYASVTRTDLTEGSTIQADLIYCDTQSYFVKYSETLASTYFHFYNFFTPFQMTDFTTKILENGDLSISYEMGPYNGIDVVFAAATKEETKMFDEFRLFDSMLNFFPRYAN